MLNIVPNEIKSRLRRLVFIVLIGYAMLGTALYLFQEKLLFLPTTLAQDHVFEFQHPFDEYFLETSDGATINALHFKAEKSKGAIFYLHGNAGDLQRWGHIVAYLVDLSYDVYIMDYRTYGKSTGKLSEEAMYADAQMCYEHLKQRINDQQVIIYGRSLGTGMATYLAAKNSPQQLILETPYYSIVDVAEHRFPVFPVSKLMKYTFPSHDFITAISCNITMFHGTDDKVIPISSGKKLLGVATPAKTQFITIEGGAHNNLVDFERYHEALRAVLK